MTIRRVESPGLHNEVIFFCILISDPEIVICFIFPMREHRACRIIQGGWLVLIEYCGV